VQLNKPNPIIHVRINNRLKEFEELLLDNTLLKVHNQALGDKKPQVEGVVANCSRVHKGVDSRKYGISPL
jgi:hypothetical protein